MASHLLGVLQPAVVFQVNGDAGCSPGVTSDGGEKARRFGPLPNSSPGVVAVQSTSRHLCSSRIYALEQGLPALKICDHNGFDTNTVPRPAYALKQYTRKRFVGATNSSRTRPKPASRPSACHREVVSGKSLAYTWALPASHSSGANAVHHGLWSSQRRSQASAVLVVRGRVLVN
jgi:hypothetical protein